MPMAMSNESLGAVILGAGASSRMGKPKLLLPWHDTTVIGQIIRQWRELGARQIAVVGRPNDQELIAQLQRETEDWGRPISAAGQSAPARRGPGGECIRDADTRRQDAVAPTALASAMHYIVNPHPDCGMFSSIQCAANWPDWRPDISVWSIILGDQPHLRLETLHAILAFCHQHPDKICQPDYGGRGRHPVLLPRPAFQELRRSQANTLKEFLKETGYPLIRCPLKDEGLPLDMDTPEDYIRLRNSLNP